MTDCKDNALSRGGNQMCHYLNADTKGNQKDADSAKNPLLKIVGCGDALNTDFCHVNHNAEQDCCGKLQKLKPIIFSAQNSNLNQNEDEIHYDRGGSHRQPGNSRSYIRNAGDRRCSKSSLNGKRYAKCHDNQTKAEEEKAFERMVDRMFCLRHDDNTFLSFNWDWMIWI